MSNKPTYKELENRIKRLENEVNKHKKSENAQRIIGEQTINILNSISDGFFSLDENLVVTYFNKAAESLLGRKSTEVIGHNLFESFPEAKDSIFEQNYTFAVKEKQRLSFETYFGVKPYQDWYQVNVYPQEKGISVYFQVSTERKQVEEELAKHRHRLEELVKERTAELLQVNEQLKKEITERKKVENELLKQQYFLSKAQEIGKIGTWELDIQKNILIWTDENYRIFGLPLGTELTYETFLSYVHPDDREYVDKEWKAALNKKPYDIEFRLLMSDGSIKWVREKAELELDEQGNCLRGIGFTQDITEHKYAQVELKESEEMFRAMFEQAAVGVAQILIDTGHYIKINQRYCDIVGYTSEEMLRLTFQDITHPEDLQADLDNKQKIREGKIDKFSMEKRYIRKDGSPVWVNLTVSPMWEAGKQLNYYISVVEDISDRKWAEKEVKKLNQNLQKRVKEEVKKSRQKDFIMMHQARLAAMGEMIGHISHQWKQPLNALNILFFNIKETLDDLEINNETIEALIPTGEKLIGTMSKTIDDFRKFFTPDRQKEEFSINKIIKDTLSIVSADFKFHEISVNMNEEEEIKILGFPNEYSQVLLNIIGNARDTITAKGIKGEIEIEIFRKNNSAIVEIADNGGGIPERFINNIFDPYFTTKKEKKGAGIGLYMSKLIIEDHMGGRIDVKNIEEGAEFRIIIPMIQS